MSEKPTSPQRGALASGSSAPPRQVQGPDDSARLLTTARALTDAAKAPTLGTSMFHTEIVRRQRAKRKLKRKAGEISTPSEAAQKANARKKRKAKNRAKRRKR